MSAITTHVLDTSRGNPASGIPILLEIHAEDAYRELGRGVTDEDGRLRTLLPDGALLDRGVYRLTFNTGAYFAHHAVESFYPEVVIYFEVRHAEQHYHVPLLLSPYGYSTYRGS